MLIAIRLLDRTPRLAGFIMGLSQREATEEIAAGIELLSGNEKKAIRNLLIKGEMTDQRAVSALHEKSVAADVNSVFYRIWDMTGFVQRLWFEKRARGYRGPWIINPNFEAQLASYFDVTRAEPYILRPEPGRPFTVHLNSWNI